MLDLQQRIYVLDGLLGRSGMGAVYLAHRADGHFEQKVAIKLIDLPLATGTFRERFRQERQILAGLQHPFIARLLDGGVTANGDPYLVMEFVDGVPIHRFCERENLSLQQRLKLFLQVCEAVQFAHQNFVVHRDLKPDNILIAADGTPRLLDFGTAKLLSPSFAAAGAGLTRDGCQSFTPQYASPEQVLGNQVTAASDTYSLGILLYLLLTGSQPYELTELTTAEMLRVICEEPPRRPAQGETQDRRLDADLDAILMKALRKEPAERYGTPVELATDVRAWLDGMPVAARRGTFRYRAAKFIRRNRISVAGSALLAVSLVAGVIGVAWQAGVANQERRRAEESAADVLVDLGEYSEAHALYAQAAETIEHLSALDPLDLRALFDLQTVLNQQAIAYETAADPSFSVSSADRRGNLAAAEKILAQEIAVLQKMIKQDPSHEECAPVLANTQVHLGTARSILHTSAETAAMA